MTVRVETIKTQIAISNFLNLHEYKKNNSINEISHEEWSELVETTLKPYKQLISSEERSNPVRIAEVIDSINAIESWVNRDPATLENFAIMGSGEVEAYKAHKIAKMTVAMRHMMHPGYDIKKAELLSDIEELTKSINVTLENMRRTSKKPDDIPNILVGKGLRASIQNNKSNTINDKYYL